MAKYSSPIPPYICPQCSAENRFAWDPNVDNDRKPKGGDIALCMACAVVTVYNDDLSQRLPTKEEIVKIRLSEQWPHIVKLAAAVAWLKASEN